MAKENIKTSTQEVVKAKVMRLRLPKIQKQIRQGYLNWANADSRFENYYPSSFRPIAVDGTIVS